MKIWKNFHDEREWRYVPDPKVLEKVKLERVIANQSILQLKEFMRMLNDLLKAKDYRDIWVSFDYEDIRYIIVPDREKRNDFIKVILDLPNDRFGGQKEKDVRKSILISKMLVLDELRKDI